MKTQRVFMSTLWGLVFITITAFAQNVPTTEDPIQEWFTKHNISIRKTFNGSKDENSPAAFSWVHNSSKEGQDFYLVDVAVKIMEYEFLKNKASSLLIYPVVEWHCLTETEKKSNKLSAALKAEYRPMPLKTYLSDGQPAEPQYPGERSYLLSPTFIFSGELSRDFNAKGSTENISLFISLSSNKPGLPGSQIRSKGGVFRCLYYPYLGCEYFHPISAGQKGNVGFGTARMYFEFWPIANLNNRYLQCLAQYSYRQRLSGTEYASNHATELSLALNFYLDGHGHFALGFEYYRGEDPKLGFIHQEKCTVGLRIKL